MPIVIILLLIIIVLLMGGAGIIFGLIYGLFVLAWAALPWFIGIIAIIFVAALIKEVIAWPGYGLSRPRRSRGTTFDPESDNVVVPEHVRQAIAEQKRLSAEANAKIQAARRERLEKK